MSKLDKYSPEYIERSLQIFCNDDFGLSVFEQIRDFEGGFDGGGADREVAFIIDEITDMATKLILFQSKPLDAVKWLRGYMNGSGEVLNYYLSIMIKILNHRISNPTPNLKLILSYLKATDFNENVYEPLPVESLPEHFLNEKSIYPEPYFKALGEVLGVLKSESDIVSEFLASHHEETVRQLAKIVDINYPQSENEPNSGKPRSRPDKAKPGVFGEINKRDEFIIKEMLRLTNVENLTVESAAGELSENKLIEISPSRISTIFRDRNKNKS